MNDNLIIANKELKSRLFIGTGKLPTYSLLPKIFSEVEIEVITVAIRRLDLKSKVENILDYIPPNITVMINTSGARNAKECIKLAEAGSAIINSKWIKVEIEVDMRYLLPDNEETIKATKELVKKGYYVFPYISPDLITARKLQDCGASAVMPLGSFIGTNKGIIAKELITSIIENIEIPVIIDAGIGRPSHASMAMEMGAAAVLINTAIATSSDPVNMTKAFFKAVEAGRLAFLTGIPTEKNFAEASSPFLDFYNKL
ncbi:MAG: thiazole synthase [Bacteroidales bacterium]|nr:thiazole synthase [Bacteroidales bacterium]